MTIAALEAKAVAIPLRQAARMSTRTVSTRHFVIAWVTTGLGQTGLGYSYVGHHGSVIVRDMVVSLLAPILQGRDESDIDGNWDAMYKQELLLGRRGALVRAMSAVDIALFDLIAKMASRPLAAHLGGYRSEVPAYASGGYYGPGDPLGLVEAEIERDRAEGFKDHKIKVGGLSVADDAERVRVARRAVGPHGRLALDANNAYRTAAEAIEAGRAFERAAAPEPIWWFEEPLPPDDIDGHAAVARALETPLATGEIHQTRWDFARLISARAAAILQADAGVVGGVSEWRKVAALAAGAGLPVAPHWHANLHIHLAAATPNCDVLEHFSLDRDIYNFERLLTPETRSHPQGGAIRVPDRPGLGIEIDPEALRAYTVHE